MHGDGPTPPMLAAHPLTRGVPAEHAGWRDAALCRLLVECRPHPVPPTSPLSAGGTEGWHGDGVLVVAAERRGWAGIARACADLGRSRRR